MEIIGQFIKSQTDYFNPYVKDISLGYCVQPQSSKTVLRIGLQDSQNIYLCFLESKIPLKHISSLQLYSVTPILFLPRYFPSGKCLVCLPPCHINMLVYSYTFHLIYPILPLSLHFILHYYVYDFCLYMTIFFRILIAIFIPAFYQFLINYSPKTQFILTWDFLHHTSSTPVFLVLCFKSKINTTFLFDLYGTSVQVSSMP